MTTYHVEDSEFAQLSGRNLLIVGGCTGIGRAAVQLAHENGANVVLGDWNEGQGQKIEKELGSQFFFKKTDVSNWDSVLSLFEFAISKLGTLDAVLSNAGVAGNEQFIEHSLDPKTGRLLPPNMKTMDVNLYGQIYVSKCALYYFSQRPQRETKCQLVMTASAAAFVDAPQLSLYTASKSGVLGLMRGARCMVAGSNVSINVIAPWATDTPMFSDRGALEIWKGMPINTPTMVARAMLLPVVRQDIHGKSFWVGGGEIIEVEDKYHESQPIWLTKGMSDKLDIGQVKIVPNWEQVVLSYKR